MSSIVDQDSPARLAGSPVSAIDPDDFDQIGIVPDANEDDLVLDAQDNMGGLRRTKFKEHLRQIHLSDNQYDADNQIRNKTELLESILMLIIPQSEARYASSLLVSQFISFASILSAPQNKILEMLPGFECVVVMLKLVQQAVVMALREPIEKRSLLSSMNAVFDYLRVSLSNEEGEVVRLLLLNSKNELIKDELHARGSLTCVEIYPREIVRRVLATNANALIIVHNHPSGDPSPSSEDFEITRQIKSALGCFNVALHDHIVVGRSGCASMRSLGLLT